MVGLPTMSDQDEQLAAKRQVYFLTFPHPHVERSKDGIELVAPGTLSREDILRRVLESCASPVYTHRWSGDGPSSVAPSMVAIFQERHKAAEDGEAHVHYHVALKAETSFRFAPVKKALLTKFGLASHWSCTHAGYWSPIQYCTMPTPSKPLVALDHKPVLWSRHGQHPPLHLCRHEPATAAAMGAKRQRREVAAAEKGRAEPRITEYELWPIVVQSGIRNKPGEKIAHLKFMEYVKESCSSAVCSFVFKNRARLPALIEDIWRWEGINQVVADAERSMSECVMAALRRPCVCGGAWLHFARGVLGQNDIRESDIVDAFSVAFREGRSSVAPAVVFAGASGGEGKSFILKGLVAVFGAENVFFSPSHPTFPFLGIDGAKVAFLDDFRFLESVVPLATQCLWFDGSAVPIAKPQNQPGSTGHDIYHGTAPVFITTKAQDIEALRAAGDGDASMLLRRLRVFTFTRRVAPPEVRVLNCAHCFARLISGRAA